MQQKNQLIMFINISTYLPTYPPIQVRTCLSCPIPIIRSIFFFYELLPRPKRVSLNPSFLVLSHYLLKSWQRISYRTFFEFSNKGSCRSTKSIAVNQSLNQWLPNNTLQRWLLNSSLLLTSQKIPLTVGRSSYLRFKF